MYTLSINILGPCHSCGNESYTVTERINIPKEFSNKEIKSLLSKKQDILVKAINKLQCDECFMKERFNLPTDVVNEIVTSSSSEAG